MEVTPQEQALWRQIEQEMDEYEGLWDEVELIEAENDRSNTFRT